jgi:4-amino-4-deoxy-L-arabinose transferase-like glycosyltransferase
LDLALSISLLVITFSRNAWRLTGTDYNWDLLNYHLNNVTNTQPLVLHPAGIQSFFSPLLDKILLPLHILIPQPYSTILMLIPVISNFVIIRYLFLRTFFIGKFKLPNSIALVSIFPAMALSQINNSMGDLVLTPIALLVIFYLFKGVSERHNKSLYLSGIFLGLLFGLKLSFAYLFFPVGVFIFSLLVAKRISFLNLFIWGVSVLVTFAALAIPHANKLYREFGNPIFPLFNAFFRSPNYDYANFRDNRFGFRNILDYFSVPFKIALGDYGGTAELVFRDIRMLLLCVTLSVAVLLVIALVFRHGHELRKKSDLLELFILGLFLFLAYITWAEYMGIQRYFIPIEILGFLFTIVFFVALAQRFHLSNLLTNCLVVFLLTFTTLSTTGVNWGHSSKHLQSTSFQEDSYDLVNTQNAAYLLVDQPLAFLKFETKNNSAQLWFGPSFNVYDNLQQMKLLKDRKIFTLSYDKNAEHLDSKLSNYSLRSKGTCKEIQLDFDNGLTPNKVFLCDTESSLK